MTEDEKARMGIAAFGALGAAVSLSFQRKEKQLWSRVAKGGTSVVAGICTAIMIVPIAAPHLDSFLRVPPDTTDSILGFLFGVTGYELWKVVYHRASKLLSGYIDKKEKDLIGSRGEETQSETPTEEVNG